MDEITFLSRKILDLNKQLIESEKAKSRFLSLIANELNNPMTGLLGMIPHLAPPVGDVREAIFDLAHEEALLLDSRIQDHCHGMLEVYTQKNETTFTIKIPHTKEGNDV